MIRSLVVTAALMGFAATPASAMVVFDFIPSMQFVEANERVSKDAKTSLTCAFEGQTAKAKHYSCPKPAKSQDVRPAVKPAN